MESNAGRRDRRVVVPSPDSEPSASRSSPARDFGNVEDATTALAAEQAYAQYAKRQSGIYKKLMPYMHKYKKKILACWEDGAHTFRLQRMPFQIQDIQYTTTCGHPYCPSEHGIMEPGALRVSIERNEHPDSEIDWSQRIPLEPIPKNFNAAWVQCMLSTANLHFPRFTVLTIPRARRRDEQGKRKGSQALAMPYVLGRSVVSEP